ncbi:MAG TPA: hypothetical protein VLD62_01215 [Acidimicrobiia bacterium]|nr:hypothetical protein [Acidimicrobiia bacterium]
MARNPDPKHGRWILPLIITAMVVLTFTFVNNLDPAVDVAGTTTVPEPPFPTTPTSTTSTLPPEFAVFEVTLEILERQVTTFGEEASRINDDWEARRVTFGEARSSFTQLADTISAWEETAADNSQVPATVAEEHVNFVVASEQLAPGIEDILAGLDAPDDGTLRRQAVDQFAAKIQTVVGTIEAMRTAVADETGDTTETSDAAEGTDA